MKIFLSRRGLKILKASFILIFSFTLINATLLAISAPQALAQDDDPVPINFTPQLTIPGSGFNQGEAMPAGEYKSGTMTSDLLLKYIKAFYRYGIGVAGILAAIVLMAGGILWLTSAGNDSKVNQAKELIAGSITGVLILFCSWIILNTINPDLVNLKPITTQIIKKVSLTCCEYTDEQNNKAADMLDKETCREKKNGVAKENFYANGSYMSYTLDTVAKKCVEPGCCIKKTSGGEVMTCLETLPSQCPTSGEFIDGTTCDKTKYADNCSGLKPSVCALPETKDGDECYEDANVYCYNKVCWLTKGEEGEPCGNNGGKCTSNAHMGWSVIWTLEPTCEGSNNYHDGGGRSCNTGLYCCYKD